jgi:hypothetical protein
VSQIVTGEHQPVDWSKEVSGNVIWVDSHTTTTTRPLAASGICKSR